LLEYQSGCLKLSVAHVIVGNFVLFPKVLGLKSLIEVLFFQVGVKAVLLVEVDMVVAVLLEVAFLEMELLVEVALEAIVVADVQI
jgi:hypothetical protein